MLCILLENMHSMHNQAEILKDQGNLYFKKERLAAAIEAYTEVMCQCLF